MKGYLNRGETAPLHFWRDSNGNEVDLIVDVGTRLMPIEIKSGQTVNRDFFTGLKRWMEFAGDQADNPTLVYGGAESYSHGGVDVVSWKKFGKTE